jgi:CCR4-NOT transcription complex subunit 9
MNVAMPPTLIDDNSKIFGLVIDLMDPGTREAALLELSKKREQFDDLALILWHSFGACFITPHLF